MWEIRRRLKFKLKLERVDGFKAFGFLGEGWEKVGGHLKVSIEGLEVGKRGVETSRVLFVPGLLGAPYFRVLLSLGS